MKCDQPRKARWPAAGILSENRNIGLAARKILLPGCYPTGAAFNILSGAAFNGYFARCKLQTATSAGAARQGRFQPQARQAHPLHPDQTPDATLLNGHGRRCRRGLISRNRARCARDGNRHCPDR